MLLVFFFECPLKFSKHNTMFDASNSSFAGWVIKMANLGFPRSKAQIIEAVKLYLDRANIKVKASNDNRPGIPWFYGFLRHHPTIKMKKTEKLEQACAMACTKECVYAWIDEFE